eukprot:6266730-Prorocentrum_lima.AAC.1
MWRRSGTAVAAARGSGAHEPLVAGLGSRRINARARGAAGSSCPRPEGGDPTHEKSIANRRHG